jgi:signal transduction histidine kinase
VTKIDQADALAPLNELRDTFLLLMLVALVISVFVALFMARSTIDPLVSLSQAAYHMSKGDLSQRVTVTTKNELGDLAQAFNNMATGLQKIDQAKTEFITLMSHQLRTPATATKGFMAMMLDGYAGKLTPDQTKLLESAYEENERQMRIVNDILLAAAADAGQMHLTKHLTNLADLAAAVVDTQVGALKVRNQTVEFSRPKKPVIAELDEEKIRMVLENLISNAAKYSGENTKITVTVKDGEAGPTVAIADHGIGIASADLPKLFQRFVRLRNPSSTHAQGSGLGLYLVKKIMDLHQGEVTMESVLGQGTIITLRFPPRP